MKKVITVNQLLMKKFEIMEFDGHWLDSFGKPERTGIWIVWGGSGNGKTRFCLQLAKYLTRFGKVAYNPLEEGARRTLQKAVIESRMKSVASKFMILDREHKEDLDERLSAKKSPDIVIIDSFQYFGLNKSEYIAFKEKHKNKLIIFVSHAEGLNPEGRVASFVRYDADVKVHVHSYQANITSRYGGGTPYIIWESENRKIMGT